MTIQELGAIGELVGGIAVIVTLIYLAVQVRQNTRMNAALIRQQLYDATQQQILTAVESTEFNDVMHRSWSTDEALTGGEQVQLWRHMQGVLMGYQGAYEQYKSGVLPEKDWLMARHFLRTFWLLDGRGKNEVWEQMCAGRFFNDDFIAEMAALKDEVLAFREELKEKNLEL